MKKILLSAVTCLSMASAASAQDCNDTARDVSAVAEIVEFRLVQGVTDEQFLNAAATSMSYLCSVDGFVRRSLSQDETGLWTDYVEWTDLDLAQSAAEAAMQREDMMPFMTTIDPDTVALRYSVIRPIK